MFGVAADKLGDEEVAVAVEVSPLDKRCSLPPSSFLSCKRVKDTIRAAHACWATPWRETNLSFSQQLKLCW